MSRSPHPSVRILNVGLEVLIEFTHVFSSDGLNNALLSQGRILETARSMGMMGRTYNPKTGKGRWEPPAFRSTGSHTLLMTSSNIEKHNNFKS